MKKLAFSSVTLALLWLTLSPTAQAHCQVPCGIYDDHARIHRFYEDITTISKAVTFITQLSGKSDALSKNQLVRWIITKEQHADKMIRVVADYFLTQKIQAPPVSDKAKYTAYLEMLARHHAVMRAAMKAKQTVDPQAVKELHLAVDGIAGYWSPKK